MQDASDEGAKPTLYYGKDSAMIGAARGRAVGAQGKDVTLNFEQAPVTDVVHAVLGDLLRVDYSIVTPLNGVVTLRTQGAVPRSQVIPLLESVLKANKIALAQDADGRFRVGSEDVVKPSGNMSTDIKEFRGGSLTVPLQYIGAAEMAEILRPITGPSAILRVDTTRNLLVLSGTRSDVEGWLEIVRTFDVDFFKGMSVGVFPLINASVAEVDAALRQLLGAASAPGAPNKSGATSALPFGALPGQTPGISGSGGTPTADKATGATSSGPLSGLVRIMPIERLNAIMVVTPRAHYLELVKTWIARLDKPSEGSGESKLWIYPVQNGSAEHLANLLNMLYGGESTTSTTTGDTGVASTLQNASRFMNSTSGDTNESGSRFGNLGTIGQNSRGGAAITQVKLGENVRIVADPNKNALLINASRRDYRRIEEVLRQLDSAPTQVLIEASILEVTLGNELQYGLQWYFKDRHYGNKGVGGFGLGAIDPSTNLPVTNNGIAALASVTSGFGYSLLTGGDIRVVLNALADKKLVNMLSNPNVMVLDNHTATIQVGDQVPVKTGTSITDGGLQTESIQYRDTGVLLSVKPSVNSGDMVTLDVDQSIVDVGAPDVASTGNRSFDQRNIVSKVAVRSGETIVLGGLIRDKKSHTKFGVPLLQDIPFLGALFRSTGEEVKRTELIVMLTPRVIRSGQDVREIGAEMRSRMSGLEKMKGDAARHVDRLGPRPQAARPASAQPAPAATPTERAIDPFDQFAPDRSR
ncbi:MAG: type II secretion system secretin GspD [Azoarcus sp.]|jgi:general secretion pathway protein D|nr:type II secretion system secretin GspD [Azoarcus sp.]